MGQELTKKFFMANKSLDGNDEIHHGGQGIANEDNQILRLRLADEWLQLSADYLEDCKRRTGSFVIASAQMGDDAARLFEFSELAKRFNRVLKGTTFSDLIGGALTNIPMTRETMAAPLNPPSLEKIEGRYPLFHDSYALDYLTELGVNQPHLQACLAKDYSRAISLASGELDRAEIVLAQIILGDFEVARSSFEDFPDRRDNFLVVSAIELFRRNRFEEAAPIVTELLSIDLLGAPSHLALGVMGRIPWHPGYPFPDY